MNPRTAPLRQESLDAASAREVVPQPLRGKDTKVRGNQLIERLYATRMPAPFLSVLTDDCIAKGRDYNAGGARYNNTFIQAVGIGTAADDLMVRVFRSALAAIDGRHAGKPLSEGISPVQGADRRGPTAVFRSAARWTT